MIETRASTLTFGRTWIHHGVLTHGQETIGDVETAISFSLDDPASLAVAIRFRDGLERSSRVAQLVGVIPQCLRIASIDPLGAGTCIDQIMGVERDGSPVVTVLAHTVTFGLPSESLREPLHVSVHAHFVPGSLGLVSDFGPGGSIAFNGEAVAATEQMQLTTPWGLLTANALWAYHDERNDIITTRRGLRCAVLEGSLEIPPAQAFESVHADLLPLIDHCARILSLCLRQTIRLGWINYTFGPLSPGERFSVGGFRRVLHDTQPSPRRDPLVDVRDLKAGGLTHLVARLRATGSQGNITPALSFLTASHSSSLLESSYFFAFSALESACAGYRAEVPGLDRTLKLELLAGLSLSVDQFATANALPSETVTILKQQLQNVGIARQDTVRRIAAALLAREVQVTDLWPGHGIEEVLALAVDARNRLFHEARMADGLQLDWLLIRIRLLVERVLLHDLGWPASKLWLWHAAELRWTHYPWPEVPRSDNSG